MLKVCAGPSWRFRVSGSETLPLRMKNRPRFFKIACHPEDFGLGKFHPRAAVGTLPYLRALSSKQKPFTFRARYDEVRLLQVPASYKIVRQQSLVSRAR